MSEYKNLEIATRCHDICVCLDSRDVPDFELIPEIGMLVRLSLHLRGLPKIQYEVAKLVGFQYLHIPTLVFGRIIRKLAEIDFVALDTTGETINSLIPNIPYFDDVYTCIGEYANTKRFNESEQLAIHILDKLTQAPQHRNSLFNDGAENKLVNRSLKIGEECGYVIETRARGKDLVYSPLFFAENAEIYSDLVAKSGADSVKRILSILEDYQGWPLSLIQKNFEINGNKLTVDEVGLLTRLAQDGAVKPPAITTSHKGTNHFMFTPTPGFSKLHPGKKDIFERAMALVAAVRQGQLLPKQYAIKSPYAILKSLKNTKYLRANTEANEQYRALIPLRIGFLENQGNGYHRFRLHETPENDEALDLAIQLVTDGSITGAEINEEARIAIQKDQAYIEGIIASSAIRKQQRVSLSEEAQLQIDDLLLGGTLL